jgi:hypothetical protein
MHRVANRAALDTCVARTLPLLAGPCHVRDSKRYWKIPELWESNVETTISQGSTAEQVLSCLVMAYNLATGWNILGSLSASSAHGFTGVFALGKTGQSNVVGLEWASFDLVSGDSAAVLSST